MMQPSTLDHTGMTWVQCGHSAATSSVWVQAGARMDPACRVRQGSLGQHTGLHLWTDLTHQTCAGSGPLTASAPLTWNQKNYPFVSHLKITTSNKCVMLTQNVSYIYKNWFVHLEIIFRIYAYYGEKERKASELSLYPCLCYDRCNLAQILCQGI